MSKPHIHLPNAAAPAPLTPLAPTSAPEADKEPSRGRRHRTRPQRAKRAKTDRAAKRGKPAEPASGAKRGKHVATTPTRAVTGRAAKHDAPAGAKPKWNEFSIGKSVSPEVVMSFSRQVASFLEAGISMLETLEIVREEIGAEPMRKVISQMSETIQRGASFSEAVAAHPNVFPGFYRAMVRAAEFTGRLDEVLNQLAGYLERDLAAKRQVKSALTYPTVVLVVATAAMVVMSIFVLPKFASMYRGLGAKLPLPTRMLLGFTDFITGSFLPIVGVLTSVLLLVLLVFGGDRGKRRRDVFAMRMPIIGNLFHLISVERFCRVLSALAKAGVPLPDAIEMSADSTNNTIFQRKLLDVRDALVRGGGLSEPMFDAGIFPIAARQMIRVGERTGSLSHQLSRAAAYYEREVAFHMKRATELFQPAVILFVGVLVGFVAIAQVAAMYTIFGQIQA